MVELIDLSGSIEERQPVYPGHVDTVFWVTETHEESSYKMERSVDGETESVRRKRKAMRQGNTEPIQQKRGMILGEHGPTHVDALIHIDPTDADETIDRMDLDWFYGDTVGVDVSHVDPSEFIQVEDIEGSLEAHSNELREGDMITLHTGHYERYFDSEDPEKKYNYVANYTGLSRDAAYWLGEQGVKNIGIDAPSIDHSNAMDTKEYPGHDMCAEYKVTNMENLANLDEVAGLRFTLAAFPLKLKGGTGSPIRPVAIVEE